MLENIKNIVWGPVCIANIVLLGAFILIKTHFYALRRLPSIFRDTVLSVTKNKSSFALMCTSLGGTIGVGNTIGVAGAIFEGGAGAVFWMAIANIIGSAIKHIEVYFSTLRSSPIGYIKDGVGMKRAASLYAFLCIGVSLGMGNMSQIKAAAVSAENVIPLPAFAVGILTVLMFLSVVRGGIEKISRFSMVFIPLFSLFYTALLCVIIVRFRFNLVAVLEEIKSGSGVFHGIKWAVIKSGITSGFSKAVFSSEAGLGSAGFAHSNSNSAPQEQAKWGVVEVLADSFICIITALGLLLCRTSIANAGESSATKAMFAVNFGKLGEIFYCLSLFAFAFSSVVCWYYNGECCVRHLSPKKSLRSGYLFVFCILMFLSFYVGDSVIFDLSDIANALMLTVNTAALWVLVFNNSLTF